MTKTEDKPIIPGKTIAQNEAVETVLTRLDENELTIPTYQRDSDEWDENKKSLFVESILNRLTVPAFYLASDEEDSEKDEIVDGQQRLTTLSDFFKNKLRLRTAEECSYFGPSLQYAGKTYDELHESWQKSFRRYNLTLVSLPDNMALNLRLEIFRRINEGGTPLSAQDIRLSYYSESKTVRFIQLAGIYDDKRPGAIRMLKSGQTIELRCPWHFSEKPFEYWKKWWNNKKTVTGQTPSEMFLWYIIANVYDDINEIIENDNHLKKHLGLSFGNKTVDVLDIVCAEFKYEDASGHPRNLPDIKNLEEEYFPQFEKWWFAMKSQCMSQVHVSRYKIIALLIPGLAQEFKNPEDLTDTQWGFVGNFISASRETAKKLEVVFPEAKGRWRGKSGQYAQIQAYTNIVKAIKQK